jgi:predicted small lipoprotein YifL
MKQRVLSALVCVLIAAGATGCGQQGPLVLPEDARPIERIDPQGAASEPAPSDEERRDER